jgi:hypothetical protein
MDDLPTGGIVGSISIIDCVTASSSAWFRGPFGLVLRDGMPLPFRSCKGKLGFFEPSLADGAPRPTGGAQENGGKRNNGFDPGCTGRPGCGGAAIVVPRRRRAPLLRLG